MYPCDVCGQETDSTFPSVDGEICALCAEKYPFQVWNGYGTFVSYDEVPDGFLEVFWGARKFFCLPEDEDDLIRVLVRQGPLTWRHFNRAKKALFEMCDEATKAGRLYLGEEYFQSAMEAWKIFCCKTEGE